MSMIEVSYWREISISPQRQNLPFILDKQITTLSWPSDHLLTSYLVPFRLAVIIFFLRFFLAFWFCCWFLSLLSSSSTLESTSRSTPRSPWSPSPRCAAMRSTMLPVLFCRADIAPTFPGTVGVRRAYKDDRVISVNKILNICWIGCF